MEVQKPVEGGAILSTTNKQHEGERLVKNTPKRLGEIVDEICREAGISERLVPRGPALHKTEAIAILTCIRCLRKRVDPTGGSSEQSTQ